jgi:hypothetical protein
MNKKISKFRHEEQNYDQIHLPHKRQHRVMNDDEVHSPEKDNKI